MMDQEAKTIARVKGKKDHGIMDDRRYTGDGNNRKPNNHDGPKHAANHRCAVSLDHKEACNQNEGNRHAQTMKRRCRDIEAFDRTEYGNRGRNDAVTIKKRGTKQARAQNQRPYPWGLHAIQRQCRQRECAALALIVRSHNDGDIFDGNNHQKCPENERTNGVDILFRYAACRHDGLFEGIKRRGADIAINNA